jgi:hypothetical protein
MPNLPLPRLSRESQRWVLQRYSFGYEHITESVDTMMRVAHYPNISELDMGHSGLNEDSAEKPKECFDKAQHERKNFQ